MSRTAELTIGLVVYDELNEIHKSLQHLLAEIKHSICDRRVHWIFVLNHPSKDLRIKILEKIRQFISDFSYFENFENNLGFARNLILNQCKTELLYFTDPDIEHPQKSLLKLLQLADMSPVNSSLIGFTGPVIHKSDSKTMDEMFLILHSIAKKIPLSFQIQNRSFLEIVDHAPTCHLLLIKNKALLIGGFSEQIPLVGEDLDFSHRAFGTEHRFLFSPQAHVLHHQNLKIKNWLRKVLFFGRAQIMVHKKNSQLPVRFYRLLPIFFAPSLLIVIVFPSLLQIIFVIAFLILFFVKRSVIYLFMTLFIYSCGEVLELILPELKLKNAAQQKTEQIALIPSSSETK